MSFSIPVPDRNDPQWTRSAGLFVRRGQGTHRTASGDVYTIKATAAETNGGLGLIEATVPSGGGPTAHAHGTEDEAFYILSGELEFLNGEETFIGTPGDFIFIPRGTRHRFKNISVHAAKMLVMFTPGGHEQFFLDYQDEAQVGREPAEWGPEKYAELEEAVRQYQVTMLPEDQ
ncbi:cupin domain-containing protein [Streptomyces sp. NPDC051217]|uniref:cupin domain-containing protein n=1 Tax=Streptomyces sp. NPDC051217 TaxID=3365644 RepID=UPI0037BD7721